MRSRRLFPSTHFDLAFTCLFAGGLVACGSDDTGAVAAVGTGGAAGANASGAGNAGAGGSNNVGGAGNGTNGNTGGTSGNTGGSNGNTGGSGGSSGSGPGGSAGAASTGLQCNYPSSIGGAVREAVANGDASKAASSAELLDASLATLKLQLSSFDADMAALFDLNADGTKKPTSLTAIDWDPTHDAVIFGEPTLGVNTPVLVTTTMTGGKVAEKRLPMALFGRLDKTPYLAFASNPFRTTGNDQMAKFLVNAIRHLTKRPAGQPVRVTLAQLDESFFFKDETGTRAWLTQQLQPDVSFNVAKECDGAKLSACVDKGTDLLIVSQMLPDGSDVGQIVKSIAAAMAKGIPVIYIQHDGEMTELGTQLFGLLKVQYGEDNYWAKYSAAKLDPSTLVAAPTPNQAAIVATLEHLKSGKFDFTLATAQTDEGKAAYQAQFGAGAGAVRAMMTGFDRRAQDIFATCGNDFPKLLALLGDTYRASIKYPLRVASSDMTTFLSAYYADHAVLNVRTLAPAQPDRGNFDPRDLSKVVAVNKTVTLTSRRDFRSAGVYALPGRPMKITRTDQGKGKVGVFVNPTRDGSTHEWEDGNYGGYGRPKFLRSATVPLQPGATVIVTSVYGGPVQLSFDTNDVEVQVAFENVGEHPHWASPADDARFAQGVASDVYNFIEVATDAFELHSTAKQFAGTLKDARWNTPATLSAAIEKYTFSGAHIEAGFQGKEVDKIPEIIDWAAGKGLTVPIVDLVKHGIMDQPSCGAGCSGNPYDAGWSFSPIGHGDLHELGHSLQRERFQLTHAAGKQTYENHAVTNWTPFYVANKYFDDHGGETSDWGIDHKDMFVALQAAYAAGERAGTFSAKMDTFFADRIATGNITDNYAFFMQAMMMARTKDKLQNGYHIVPRIHLLDNAFGAARKDAATWDAAKEKLGFGSFTLDEANAMGRNDFMAVAMSFVTGLDYRDFFDMFGLAIGDKAKAQIASYKHAAVERAFFALDKVGHNHGALSTKPGDFKKIVLDGTTAWPLE